MINSISKTMTKLNIYFGLEEEDGRISPLQDRLIYYGALGFLILSAVVFIVKLITI